MAPFTPFISEKIYQILSGGLESVHLEDWPKKDVTSQNIELEKEMVQARNFVEQIHAKRHEAEIKLRQPLSCATINGKNIVIRSEIIKIMSDELNVKKIAIVESKEELVTLDTVITEELKLEGQLRDFVRTIQELRKGANVAYDQVVSVAYEDTVENKKIVEKYHDEICKQALVKELTPNESFKIL